MSDTCRSCNAPIVWTLTENGKRAPGYSVDRVDNDHKAIYWRVNNGWEERHALTTPMRVRGAT